jgi:hypothetical protein
MNYILIFFNHFYVFPLFLVTTTGYYSFSELSDLLIEDKVAACY